MNFPEAFSCYPENFLFLQSELVERNSTSLPAIGLGVDLTIRLMFYLNSGEESIIIIIKSCFYK